MSTVVERADAVSNGVPLQPENMTVLSTSSHRFDVALSFPGERREFVAAVADRLAAELGKERILYDKYHEAEFARPDLSTEMRGSLNFSVATLWANPA